MPNRKQHQTVGTVSGLVIAAYRARHQNPTHLALESLGGALGGWLAGPLPDVLEPSFRNPRHRKFAHSITAGSALLAAARNTVADWESSCREKADRFATARSAAAGLLDRVLLFFAEAFWRVTAGLAAGFMAGYVSHLLLDSGTKDSLPLLTR